MSFVDSYKRLGGHDSDYAELLIFLRKNPKILAQCLLNGDKLNSGLIQNVCQVIISSVYNHCVFPEDKAFVLQMLKELLVNQLAQNDNPRRLLRHGTCAFSRIYKIFSEGLLDAKSFLTSALHNAIMQLLTEDDLFLDIDPSKAVVRFAPQERLRHFGQEGTASYSANLQKYRIWTINRLSACTLKFIEGIQESMYCFPQSLAWLIRQLYIILSKTKRFEAREIGAMCTDLIFGFFICPAIVNPELFGIIDAHISHIARFNLMQVAQNIQVLAMVKWEDIDPKLSDLYDKFPKRCMTSVLDFILERANDDSLFDIVQNLRDVSRISVLITENELKTFVEFIQIINHEAKDSNLKKKLSEFLTSIPECQNEEKFQQPVNKINTQVSESHLESSPRTRKSILNRVTRRSRTQELPKNEVDTSHNQGSKNEENQLGTKGFVSEVLVIPLSTNRESVSLGMWSEEKVLRMEQQKRHTRVRMNLDVCHPNEETESVISAVSGSVPSDVAVEKRTRFSLSQDQESVGTSDNLEAISEAASNHSVASSLDLENENDNENDNLSDMVSANVSSGRETPNVSGRDTPSSHSPQHSAQHSSDEELEEPIVNNVPASNLPQPRALNSIPVAQPNRPNNRDDIEDKFGKFDIKSMASGDETKSMLSDTWSTDVLASDSEVLEQSEVAAAAIAANMNLLGFGVNQLQHVPHSLQSVLDGSETASQSDAWSTDVLTSDTERLQEFDAEETASVTRSDEMSATRSEPDIDENVASGAGGAMGDLLSFEDDNPKDGTIKHKVHRQNMTQEESRFLRQKLSSSNASTDTLKTFPVNTKPSTSPLTIEINDNEKLFNNDLTPTANNNAACGSSLLSSNMQTLGRLSFEVRKLEDEETVTPLINETLPESSNKRSSLVELLSTDFSCNQSVANAQDDLALIDFEKEFLSHPPVPENISVNAKETNPLQLSEESLPQNDSRVDDSSVSNTNSASDSRFSFASNSSTSTSSSANASMDQAVAQNFTQTQQQGLQNGSAVVEAVILPTASTGAIPKNTNYHKNKSLHNRHSAFRRLSYEDEQNKHSSNKKSFFKLPNLKTTFREKMKSFRDKRPSIETDNVIEIFSPDDEHEPSHGRLNGNVLESSDDILAKYRSKNVEVTDSRNCSEDLIDITIEEPSKTVLDETEVFNIAKRKIRKVLGSKDILTLPWAMNNAISSANATRSDKNHDNELVKLFKVRFFIFHLSVFMNQFLSFIVLVSRSYKFAKFYSYCRSS